MKIYRQHNCNAHRRNVQTFMKCAIRRAAWVHGRGPFALIAWCGTPTVTLWTRVQDADEAKKQIDVFGCGGRCRGRHEVVAIDWKAKVTA